MALWYGHRISIDIDLFGEVTDKPAIVNALSKRFGHDFQFEPSSREWEWAIFCFIKEVKVDIVNYNHPKVNPVQVEGDIRLADILDIAAMKINAILGRGNKKDFWDLYQILQHHSLHEVISAYFAKYPNQMLLISIPRALTYFKDAESSDNPICLKGHTWEDIKRNISLKVSQYLA